MKPMQNPVLGWMQVPAVAYWHLLPHVFSAAASVGIDVGAGGHERRDDARLPAHRRLITAWWVRPQLAVHPCDRLPVVRPETKRRRDGGDINKC